MKIKQIRISFWIENKFKEINSKTKFFIRILRKTRYWKKYLNQNNHEIGRIKSVKETIHENKDQ